MNLSGKRVLVTGASSGIGLALAKQLDQRGSRVMAVARSIGNVNLDGDNVRKYACDVSVRQNVDRLFDVAIKEIGGVDVLVCNAGFAYYGRVVAADWDAIERIYRLNVFSSLYSALKMKEIHAERPYRVVLTASAMSFLSVPGYALYASTKAALRGFATAYRYELSQDQRLHLVYPIATRTGFFDAAGHDTPVPWPCQNPDTVARAIIKGLENDTDDIFPSRLFWLLNALNGVLPCVHKGIAAWENRKLRKYHAQHEARPNSTGI
jgi:short-subunit dehydrogenase